MVYSSEDIDLIYQKHCHGNKVKVLNRKSIAAKKIRPHNMRAEFYPDGCVILETVGSYLEGKKGNGQSSPLCIYPNELKDLIGSLISFED